MLTSATGSSRANRTMPPSRQGAAARRQAVMEQYFSSSCGEIRIWRYRVTPEGLVALIEQPSCTSANIGLDQIRLVFIAHGATYDPLLRGGWCVLYSYFARKPLDVEHALLEVMAAKEQEGFRQFLCSMWRSLTALEVDPEGAVSVPGGFIYLARTAGHALEVRHLRFESSGPAESVLHRQEIPAVPPFKPELERAWGAMYEYAANLQVTQRNSAMHWPAYVRTGDLLHESRCNLTFNTLDVMVRNNASLTTGLIQESARLSPLEHRPWGRPTFFEWACSRRVDVSVFDTIVDRLLEAQSPGQVGEDLLETAISRRNLQGLHCLLHRQSDLGLDVRAIEAQVSHAGVWGAFHEGIELVRAHLARANAESVMAEILQDLAKAAPSAS